MFRNYLAAALRNLTRNKLVSVINVVGLAIGFAAALLIGLYLRYQLTYENFLPGHGQVYRLSLTIEPPGNPPEISDAADVFMAGYLKTDYPDVAMTARIGVLWTSVRRGEFEHAEGIFFADPDFFRMMPFPLVAGDLATALDAPDGLVITRAIARRYFGNENPLGQTLEVDRTVLLRVLAVIDDLPGNTHFNFRMVGSSKSKLSMQSVAEAERAKADQMWLGAFTYFQMRDGANVARIEADAQNFLRRHYPKEPGVGTTINIHPLTRVHLVPTGRFPLSPTTNPRTLWTLGLVGSLVLLLAVINFVNLMTARAAQRAVEVGVRKSAGARRADLIAQFLGESCLYVFAAMVVAMALVELALPTFNTMLSIGADDEQAQVATMTFQYWREPTLAAMLLFTTLGVALLAGAYPAFVMSAMRPISALHRGTATPGSARVRQTLVVLQLAALIALLFCTAVIHRQMTFSLTDGLRIDRDQVMLLFFKQQQPSEAFKDAIARVPGVTGVTAAAAAPTNYDASGGQFRRPASATSVRLQIAPIDYNFFEFYRIKPLAGRLPSRDHGTDLMVFSDTRRHLSVFVNESAVRALGFSSPAAAIEQPILPLDVPFAPPASTTIAGVIPDIPVESVRTRIQPAMYIVIPGATRLVSIRLAGRQIPETEAAIDTVWGRLGEPMAPSHLFLDLYFRRMYIDIIQQRRVLGYLSGVAVFLSCLGLFGLSIYTAQRRVKEIGIRKVMGASTSAVMRMLLWAFSKPVIWASLLAWPVAAWVMNRWLEEFVYRVDLGWWLLPVASLLALATTLVTVSVHSALVARAKPAIALRYE
jgi:putative ABC transport system permease protein